MKALILLFCLMLGLPGLAEDAPKVIVIDPGHGGKHDEDDSGSAEKENRSGANNATLVSDSKVTERLLTLELSKRIEQIINSRKEEKVKCVLTRTKDEENPDFTERVARAAQAKPAVLVSLHFNSGEAEKANGPVVIYARKAVNPNFEREVKLAESLTTAIRETTQRFEKEGFTTYKTHFGDESFVTPKKEPGKIFRPNGFFFFVQVRKNPALKEVPAIYLEVEFLQSKRYEARTRELFVTRKNEVFESWARTIAEVLIAEVAPGPKASPEAEPRK